MSTTRLHTQATSKAEHTYTCWNEEESADNCEITLLTAPKYGPGFKGK